MNQDKIKYKTGVIHGRFQVLHNDHMKYILAGKELCGHLVVGITNPDPFLTKKDNADPERSDPLANPLTYYERYRMLRKALTACIREEEFSIVPLPINMPRLYRHYVPLDAVFFLTIYDDWGRKKLKYFKTLGLLTHILWERSPEEKGISSSDIRARMLGRDKWEHLVPESVADYIRGLDIPGRLKQITDSALDREDSEED